jgi:hypothetical protein
MKRSAGLLTALLLVVTSGFAQAQEWSNKGTVTGFAAAGNGYLYEAIYDSGVFPITGGPALTGQIPNSGDIENVIISFIPYAYGGNFGFVAGVAALKNNGQNDGGVYTYGFQSGPQSGWMKIGGSGGLSGGLPLGKSINALAWHDSTVYAGLPGYDLSASFVSPGGVYSCSYPTGWSSRNGPVMLDSSIVASLYMDGSTLYAGLFSNYIASQTGGFGNQGSIGPGGVLRSTDLGQTWADISPDQTSFPHSRDVYNVFRMGTKLFISTFFSGVLYRADVTGRWVYANLPYLVSRFATDGTNLYAGVFTFDSSASSPYIPGRVYRYVESTNTWTKIFEKDSTSVSALCVFHNTLYIGTGQLMGIPSKELGYFTISNLTGVSGSANAPLTFALKPNFPNPFNPSTRISFAITKEGPVSLRVYDVLGREVATLVNQNRRPGEYTEEFNGNQMASGVYVYVLRSAEGQLVGRMMLLK